MARPSLSSRAALPALLAATLLAGPARARPDDEARQLALAALLEPARRALEDADADPPWVALDPEGPGSQDAFLSVLESRLFLHRAVGPLDLFVFQADELAAEPAARKILEQAGAGLEPLAELLGRAFSGDGGLVAGVRFPVVLAQSPRGAPRPTAFARLVALLDWAEDDYTAWKPDGNPLWEPSAPDRLEVRNWEALLLNLGHPSAQVEGFLEHGLGYQVLSHVVARLLRMGAWGLVPPWLAQGLVDELDIQAYGEAWVGGDWWERQTPGWYRPGWSGFVPQGASPPPPVTGPPANLAVKVVKTGDSWQHRANSPERHWAELAADRKGEAPASFRFMAENESFLPRDRALARATLHVLLQLAPPERRPGLLRLLDRPPRRPPSGMPDVDPLTVVVDRLLGGLPAIATLESLPTDEMLARIGHPGVAARIRELGGAEALSLSDHRDQAAWLYAIPEEELDAAVRQQLFELFLEAEYYQQLAEWELLGEALDRGMAAALQVADRGYPQQAALQRRLASAFWEAVAADSGGAGGR